MIVADFVVPFNHLEVKGDFQKGSIADTAYFSNGLEHFEDLPKRSVVLFFVENSLGEKVSLPTIKALGNLFPSWICGSVVVLGNMIVSENETYNKDTFSDLIRLIVRNGHFPVVFSSDLSYTKIFASCIAEQECLNLSMVAPSINTKNPNGSASIYNEFDEHLIRSLKSIAVLGIQSYFSSSDFEARFSDKYFQKVRLGTLRASLRLGESSLRDSNLLFVDCNVLRASDFSISTSPSPNGMYAEEFCRLLRYAGFSDNLKGTFIGGYKETCSGNESDLMLLAQGLWHLIEGFMNRKQELPGIVSFPSKEFFVELGEQNPVTLNFLQSTTTERWWLLIPKGIDGGCWIACDEEDYERAKHHELPYRWVLSQKLI